MTNKFLISFHSSPFPYPFLFLAFSFLPSTVICHNASFLDSHPIIQQFNNSVLFCLLVCMCPLIFISIFIFPLLGLCVCCYFACCHPTNSSSHSFSSLFPLSRILLSLFLSFSSSFWFLTFFFSSALCKSNNSCT